jgi:hypothetical protein
MKPSYQCARKPTVYCAVTLTKGAKKKPLIAMDDGIVVFTAETASKGALVSWDAVIDAVRDALAACPKMRDDVRAAINESTLNPPEYLYRGATIVERDYRFTYSGGTFTEYGVSSMDAVMRRVGALLDDGDLSGAAALRAAYRAKLVVMEPS